MRYRVWHLSLTHAFEVAIASVWTLSGLAWLISPQRTAVHSPLGGAFSSWFYFWATCEILGGALVMYGIYFKHVRTRGFGLSILATGLFGQFIATVAASPTDPRSYNYLIFTIFLGLKVLMLKRVYVDRYTYQL